MKTLLQIQSSLSSDDGQSSQLAHRFAARWLQANPGGRIVVRDLARNPVPHLTAERFQAFLTDPEDRSPRQREIVAESETLIGELEAADAIAIGLPMYNFGIPSTLKAWIDHVARAGRTFRYTENGPEGLLADRPVYLLAARGGLYHGTPRDTQSAYMMNFLGFIGLHDVEFVYAEGLALGAEEAQATLQNAHAQIDRLAGVRLAA
ncbi:FMN-dependent NADH-azoreductase [Elongatibacter sediminis]|uniref:FMN dependent NADH:quinone oxidoreductase n=1 Tax=Elongatibacter sediminis TaxID=3119006 RepID=A0AAW9RHZ0_9GAMM